MIRAGFSMAAGPLGWAVHIFKNSLVFHDPDNTASVFIHLSPFVLFWCMRWGAGLGFKAMENDFPGMFQVCDAEEDYAASDECLSSFQGMMWCNACTAPVSAFLVTPFLLYMFIWWIPYLLIVLIGLNDWVKKTGRETLYTYFIQLHPEMHAMFEKKLKGVFGKQAGAVGYMFLHLGMTIGLCIFAYIFWHSFLLHTLFFGFIMATAVHNGSTYTFRIFAYRYVEEQIEKHRTVLEKTS